MNVFLIPSWYPSDSDPLYGIFFKEQALYLAQHFPQLRVGVCVWAQGEDRFFLSRKGWATAPQKIMASFRTGESRKPLLPNLVEYHSPVLQWTQKLFSGNMRGLLAASRSNFIRFREEVGPVQMLHAHVAFPAGYIAMRLSEEFGVPYLITEHMGPFPFPSLLRPDGTLMKKVSGPLAKASRTIAVSEALAQQMMHYGVQKPIVIPNVVDEDFFMPASKPGTRGKGFTFFSLASLVPEKGIAELVRAVGQVVQVQRNISFRIGGEGPAADSFRQLAQQLGLTSFINWLGPLRRDQVVQEFHRADAFVLPSRWESFGLVYAEAMACGLPVIATRCGGPESMIHGQNGILTEVSDVPALTQALLAMAQGEITYNRSAIRQDFLNRFSKKAVLPQILRTYEEVASAAGKQEGEAPG